MLCLGVEISTGSYLQFDSVIRSMHQVLVGAKVSLRRLPVEQFNWNCSWRGPNPSAIPQDWWSGSSRRGLRYDGGINFQTGRGGLDDELFELSSARADVFDVAAAIQPSCAVSGDTDLFSARCAADNVDGHVSCRSDDGWIAVGAPFRQPQQDREGHPAAAFHHLSTSAVGLAAPRLLDYFV